MGILINESKKVFNLNSIIEKRILIFLNFFGVSVFILMLKLNPLKNSDGYIWESLGNNFFKNVGQSDGQHRPLFGFIAYLISLPLRIIPLDFNLTLYNAGAVDHLKNTIISGTPAKVIIAYIISNLIFYIISINLAFFTAKLLVKDNVTSLIFASLVAISGEFISWMSDIPIMIQGTSIIYISLFMLALFVSQENNSKRQKLARSAGLVYGILMLGKAEYNILISIILVTIILYRKNIRFLIIFVYSQFLPLFIWILALVFTTGSYKVYEIERDAGDPYSITNYWSQILGFDNFTSMSNSLFAKPIYGGLSSTFYGIGLISTIAILVFIGYLLASTRKEIGIAVFLYLFITFYFLYLVNFLIPRHSFEVAWIGYLGLSLALANLIRLKVFKNNFIRALILVVIFGVIFYSNWLRYPVIVGIPHSLELPLF
jgi:hypothetical protein